MADERNPWERMHGEPLLWYRRFERFRLMEPVHSIALVYQGEQKGAKGSKKPSGRWYEKAKEWQWEERAAAWDKSETDRVEKERQAYIDSILQEGYALKHERVKALVFMAQLIEKSYMDESGKPFFPWFTPEKIREWRGCLDDIAKTLGERDSKGSLKLKSDGPFEFETEWGGGALPDEDMEA